MLQDAVEEIERMPIGEALPLASMEQLKGAYNASRLLLPLRLSEQMRAKLVELDPHQVFAELRMYNETSVPADTVKLMTGVLCLVGRERKTVTTWKAIRGQLTRETLDEMLELDLEDTPLEVLTGRWAESMRATRSLDRALPTHHQPTGDGDRQRGP